MGVVDLKLVFEPAAGYLPQAISGKHTSSVMRRRLVGRCMRYVCDPPVWSRVVADPERGIPLIHMVSYRFASSIAITDKLCPDKLFYQVVGVRKGTRCSRCGGTGR